MHEGIVAGYKHGADEKIRIEFGYRDDHGPGMNMCLAMWKEHGRV